MRSRLRRGAAALRRRLPAVTVPATAGLRGSILHAVPARRVDARAQMRFLLEHTRADVDVGKVARRYTLEMALRGEARYHRSLLRQHVEGVDAVKGLATQGRGVVINFMHHGGYDGMTTSIGDLGVARHTMLDPVFFAAEADAHLVQRLRNLRAVGTTPQNIAIGSAGIAGLLRAGEVVFLASDVPGRTPVSFVGRRLLGSSGAARVAFLTDSPVVTLTSHRDGDRRWMRLNAPLEPREFAAPEAMLVEMLTQHETAMVAWPEAADAPLTRWVMLD